MGTRNLTAVKSNGEIKVAQYGQWDGYPAGVGQDIVNFLIGGIDLDTLRERLEMVEFISEGELKDLWTECGADPDSNMVNMEVSNNFKTEYPELHRDCSGGDVLSIIYNNEDCRPIKLQDSMDFGADGLYCEWAYLLDLDKNELIVNEGFITEEHSKGEWAGKDPYEAHDGTKYYPVKPIVGFDLTKPKLDERYKEWMERRSKELEEE